MGEKKKNKPMDFGPREKMKLRGPQTLSDEELLSVIIGSGGKDKNVFSIAKEIKQLIDEGEIDYEKLVSIPDMGEAKALRMLAVMELCRRNNEKQRIKIKDAEDVFNLVRDVTDRKKEYFVLLTIDGGMYLIKRRVIFMGTLNYSPVHPREIFATALEDRAAYIIVAHNHPSGDLTPSVEDEKITIKLRDIGKLLGIPLLDHLIISPTGFYSFQKESNIL